MRIQCALLSLVGLFALVTPAAAVDLGTLLANMDAASERFRGMEADVRWVKYTAIVEDENVEEGVLKVRRDKNGTFRLLIEFQRPYPYYLLVQGDKVEIYRPKIATVEEYDVSDSRASLEQALLLGFGTAGTFLRENYTVSLEGEEEAAGEQTVHLELIPKTEEMQRKIPRLEMWVSTENWQPVQQKLWETNPGDYRLYTYSDITLNPALPDSAFRLKIPKSVKRVFPQR